MPADPLTLRLVGLAAGLALPGPGPRVEEAVSLALDLLLADRDTPATVAVASVGSGATWRDTGDDIRRMLEEQGVVVPDPQPGADAAFTAALWALGLGALGVDEFSGLLYSYLPAWDEQSEVERKLVLLLEEWEREPGSEPIAAAIRRVAAEATTGGVA